MKDENNPIIFFRPALKQIASPPPKHSEDHQCSIVIYSTVKKTQKCILWDIKIIKTEYDL